MTRPITDRVKEAVFSLLRGHYEDMNVVDLFAGTGSIGLETISRGARRCLFVEQNRSMLRVLKSNINGMLAAEQSIVYQGDALSPAWLPRVPMPLHLAFLDPPYPLMHDERQRGRVLSIMARLGEAIDDDGFIVLRTPSKHLTEDDLVVPTLDGPEQHRYGTTTINLYARRNEAP